MSNDSIRMEIAIPQDEGGRVGRKCIDANCSPGYFKVKHGTGIVADHTTAYCPYCGTEAEPNDFATGDQLRYAQEQAIAEFGDQFNRAMKNALGIGSSGRRTIDGGFLSMELSYTPGWRPHKQRPVEEEVRRDVVCPHCGLDQTVFGLATWCADCGSDIFATHVDAELLVTRAMLGDVDRRRELLGPRAEAKDLENCLEDAVSIFEASMKAMTRRWLKAHGATSDDIDSRMKSIGNAFQSVTRTKAQLSDVLGLAAPSSVNWEFLHQAFEKRHPITHNLGVVDRKYLERAQASDSHGREVRITRAENEAVLAEVSTAVGAVHHLLFPTPS